MEADDELFQGLALLGCAGVGRETVAADSSCIGNADGTVVPAQCVGPLFVIGTPRLDAAVEGDVEVVAYGAESALAVPEINVCHVDIVVGTCGCAMDDDGVFLCHDFFLLF